MTRNVNSMVSGSQYAGLPPIAGTWYHVLPGIASIQNAQGLQRVGSSSNHGLDLSQPLDSIATAYDKCVSGAGDGIVLWSYGTTTAATSSYLTTAITWSKHGITVVGACAPTMFNMRSRVLNKSTTTDLSYIINLTGNNNAFYNMAVINNGTTGAGGVLVSGLRNYFENCHLMGGVGMSTPTVNDYSLYLSAAEENTFVNCVIGTDTFDKTDVAGAELFFASGCMRNYFKGCTFLSYRSAVTAAPGLIKLIGAGDSIYRSQYFDNCLFHLYDEGAMAASTACIIGIMPNNGLFIMKDSYLVGCADWAAAANARVIVFNAASSTDGQRGIAANAS